MEGYIDNIRDGTRVVAVPSPFRWNIEDSDIAGVRGIRFVLCIYEYLLMCIDFLLVGYWSTVLFSA